MLLSLCGPNRFVLCVGCFFVVFFLTSCIHVKSKSQDMPRFASGYKRHGLSDIKKAAQMSGLLPSV